MNDVQSEFSVEAPVEEKSVNSCAEVKTLNKKTMRDVEKRYLISSLITFGSTFVLVFLAQIQSIGLESFTQSIALSVGLTAIRAGIKAVVEYLNGTLK